VIALLRTDGLTKAFGQNPVLDGVGMSVDGGAIAAVIGPNGAGKTTLLNLVSGFLPPTGGTIELDGRRIDRMSSFRRCRAGIGRTFQQPSLFPQLTAAENVQIPLLGAAGLHRRPLGRAGRAKRGEALEILDAVGLAEVAGAPASSLSYGDQRRLEFGIALGTRPRLLLLDEPMAGMSAAERRSLSALVRDLRARHGLTIVFTEHDMDVVFSVGEVVHVLYQGRLLASGAPAEIRADPEVRRVYLGEDDP
jgi:branched-chain amino acid transport system ATP-binding protein